MIEKDNLGLGRKNVNYPKVVIITGASRGLGAAVSRSLGKTGTAVSLVARSKKELGGVEGEVKHLSGKPLAIPADVSSEKACVEVVAKTVDRFGRLDAIVNNAGVLHPLNIIAKADPADWRYNLEVNVLGPFYLMRAALDELRKRRGCIINVSSGAATTAIEGASAYCTSKAALKKSVKMALLLLGVLVIKKPINMAKNIIDSI